mmetsp:Transcript_30235/g.30719  ORF Transcript_30235/g.30719 Transcript_30235/m.30719 type:complete len:321 (+) Transcript_30235:19-981(+)
MLSQPAAPNLWNPTVRDASSIHNKRLCEVKFNCDGTLLGSATIDRTVKIGQLSDKSVMATIRIIHAIPCIVSIAEICWHPTDPNRFAVITGDKIVDIWDVRATRPAAKLYSLGNNIHAAWSPNGLYLAVGNNSDVLLVYDMLEFKQIKKARYSYEMNEIGWSINSDYLLIAYGGKLPDSGGIDVLSLDKELELVHTAQSHTGNAYSLQVDPTFRRLAMSSGDSLVSVWDLEELIVYRGLQVMDTVTHISFSGDGNFLALAGDNHLVVCDAESGEVMCRVDCRMKVLGLTWHPSLSLIAVALDESTARERERERGWVGEGR